LIACAKHPDPDGRPAERDAVPRRPGRLAARAEPQGAGGALTRFANAYTASPLCAPGRASFMSGQLPRRTRVYDNAAEFASDIPTFAHHLRRAGYQTCLSGKMHFVGPDQLHGFEERLTTDIYPADFGWTPDYRKPGERIDWWYHNWARSPARAWPRSPTRWNMTTRSPITPPAEALRPRARQDDRPWCLTVSFTHPHDPYVARRGSGISTRTASICSPRFRRWPMRTTTRIRKRIFDANDWRSFDITEEDIRPLAPRLFRQHLLSRRQDRRDPGRAGGTRQEAIVSSSPTMATCWASAGCGSR
jgi:choline-sulfatase